MPKGSPVPPLSIQQIRTTANQFRKILGLEEEAHLPLGHILEVLPLCMEGFVLAITPREEMTEHGRTQADNRVMEIREDVYDGMRGGIGRDRFTVAHEIGHLLLHDGVVAVYPRGEASHPPYRDSEWQANTFAAELLMPIHLITGLSRPEEVAQLCGVSCDAARVRLEKLAEEKNRTTGLARCPVLKA